MQKILTTIGIPIFNETSKVHNLIERIIALPLKKEIMIIDDGSTAYETKKVLSVIKSRFPNVRIIVNKQNQGKVFSIRKALLYARGDLFAILDGDSELYPEDLPLLYKKLTTGRARLVSGARIMTRQPDNPIYINTALTIYRKCIALLVYVFYGRKFKDVISGYKLFYTKDFRDYAFVSTRFGLETEILLESINENRQIAEVAVRYDPRSYADGKKISFMDGLEIVSCLMSKLSARIVLRSPLAFGLLLFLVWYLPFLVYNLPTSASPTSDTIPNTFTSINILYHRRLDLDNFRPYFDKRGLTSFMTVIDKSGKLYSKTPVINGILSAPYIFFADRIYLNHLPNVVDFMHKDYETYYQFVGKKYGALLASLSCLFIFLALWALFKKRYIAILSTLAYAFASSVYSTAAQGNWQHAPSLLLVSISYFLLIRYLTRVNKSYLLIISLLLGVAALLRVANILFLLSIVFVFMFYKKTRRQVAYLLLPGFLVYLSWSALLSLLQIPGGYDTEIWKSIQAINVFNMAKVLISLLVSPNVGLLVFSPVFLISLLGIGLTLRQVAKTTSWQNQPLLIFLAISILNVSGLLLFVSSWWAWEGGYSWGPRLLTETLPFLTYLGAFAVYAVRNRLMRLAILLLFASTISFSILVQAVGVFAYDTSWHTRYYKGRNRMEMAWYTHPSLITYYVFIKRKYFTVGISRQGTKLRIEKTYYLLDALEAKFRELSRSDKYL